MYLKEMVLNGCVLKYKKYLYFNNYFFCKKYNTKNYYNDRYTTE